ncbi:efflux RND transporter periplasmic adaptor subunit [Ideonella sp. DXS29W]|uniref:Efflux RND transporter periplasmic adaptor subunit n=1 Tax=Ideonella lacteola TaxID=2984193 RepID=A0ABU9BMR5_9BURK
MTAASAASRPLGFLRFAWRSWWGRIALLLLLSGAGWAAWGAFGPSKPPPEPPNGEAAPADITQVVQAAGILQPRTKVDVGAQVSGQVRKIHVELGQQVKKGELLVSLDSELARSDVAQAEAAVAQQAALIDSTQASLSLARREAERLHRLLRNEAAAITETERADTELAKLEADLRGQSATLKRLQAELDQRQLRLGYTAITAPMNGTVVNLAVQEGQTVIAVQVTPVMVTLADLGEFTVRARVPEADIAQVRPGQQASFVTLAGEAQRYEGKLRVIQPIPERVGNAVFYNVLFEVPNREGSLLSDMTVQVSIETGRAAQALAIPMVALGPRGADGRYVVQALGTGGKVEQRLIRTGLQDGAKIQVLEGLKAGDKVLLAPLPPGAASAASAAG